MLTFLLLYLTTALCFVIYFIMYGYFDPYNLKEVGLLLFLCLFWPALFFIK